MPADPDWEEATADVLARWREIERTMEEEPEQVLDALTWMAELCDRRDGLPAGRSVASGSPCQFCPLYYYAWEGRRGDMDCRSVLNDMIHLVRAGDGAQARRQVVELIRGLEGFSREDEARLSPTFYGREGPADR